MQTIIHLDGDVITRIQPDKASDRDLHALHNASVVTSVQLWQGLVTTLRAFAEGLGLRAIAARSRFFLTPGSHPRRRGSIPLNLPPESSSP